MTSQPLRWLAHRRLALLLAVAAFVLANAGHTQPAGTQGLAAAATVPQPPSTLAGAVGPPVERDSPRAALARFFDASRAGRWDDAAHYLVLSDEQKPHAARLARRLKGVIDGHRWLDLETVSGASSGRLDDGLPAELEEVERIPVGNREESMRMLRVTDASGAHWAFSPTTVERIDLWYSQLRDRWVRDAIVYTGTDALLLRAGPLELLWWQWLAIPLLVAISWAVGGLLGGLTRSLLRRIVDASAIVWTHNVVSRIGAPLTLVWALNLFWFGARYLALTDPANASLESFVTAGIAFSLFWALWLSSGVIVEQLLLRPWALRSASARTVVTVGGNFARSAIFSLGGLAVLAAGGYPVGTLLAGLGIGGLAIAFGAQKTIENVFGSLSLVVDQPFRVGDFVSVDNFVGTVEDIGLRSTRFRTLDRTVVSIPNGKLSEQRLESYEARDRMRLATTLAIRYGTTHAQMQAVLEGAEAVLRTHPHIWPESVTVRLKTLGQNALEIEVVAWFTVRTWGEFQTCRQEVLLGFMQVVEDAGTAFAFPTRTVHVSGPASIQ
jgi:MscS family membrane protein